MVKRIVFVLLLFVGTWCDATFAWARGTSLVTPPTEMVGQIRVVDRTQNRVVLVPLLRPVSRIVRTRVTVRGLRVVSFSITKGVECPRCLAADILRLVDRQRENAVGLSGGHRVPLAAGAVLLGRYELSTDLAYSGCGWLRDLPRFAGTDAHGHPPRKRATVRELRWFRRPMRRCRVTVDHG